MKCWGTNRFGQLGLGLAVQSRGGQPGDMGDALPFIELGTNLTAAELVCGGFHCCVILNSGGLKCWGRNDYGQLGIGNHLGRGTKSSDMGDNLPTVALGMGRNASFVSLGLLYSCVILSDDRVACWGQNVYGQLGLGDTTSRGTDPAHMGEGLELVDLGVPLQVVSLLSGDGHTCALLVSGDLKCWGLNDSGQLGLGDIDNRGDSHGEMGVALPSVSVSTLCTSCEPGRFKSDESFACIRCDRTGYQPSGEPSGCAVCDAGKYSDQFGAASCSLCPAGKWSDGVAQGSSVACKNCPDGERSCPGSSVCLRCEAGTYLDCKPEGGSLCRSCPAGKYGAVEGTSSEADGCRACLPGTYQDQPGSNICTSCSIGRYRVDEGAQFASDCLPCEAGKYGTATNKTSCSDCLPGWYQNQMGSVGCKPCPKGSFNPDGRGFREASCLPCGNFAETANASSTAISDCFCIAGRYSSVADSTKILECDICPGDFNCSGTGTTLATLPLKPGFWRVSNSTLQISECPYGNHCVGGDAFGERLCRPGSFGWACAVCQDGYFFSASESECLQCPKADDAVLGITAISVTIFCLLVGLYIFFSRKAVGMLENHLKDELGLAIGLSKLPGPGTELTKAVTSPVGGGNAGPEKDSDGSNVELARSSGSFLERARAGSFLQRAKEKLKSPATKNKLVEIQAILLISLSLAQVLSSFGATLSLPSVFKKFASGLNVVSFNFDRYLTRMACARKYDFFDQLIITVFSPFVLAILLGVAYFSMRRCYVESPPKLAALRAVLVTVWCLLLISYVFLPPVSSRILEAFDCQNIVLTEDGTSISLLRSDYSIDCSSKRYARLSVFAYIAAAVIPIGIPLLYFILLFRRRHRINPAPGRPIKEVEALRHNDKSLLPFKILFMAYHPHLWWWECYECIRRLLLTSVLSLFERDSSAIYFFPFVVSLLSTQMYGHFRPFIKPELNFVGEVAQWQVFVTAFSALSLHLEQRFSVGASLDSSTLGVVLVGLSALSAAIIPIFVIVKKMKGDSGLNTREAFDSFESVKFG